MRQVYRVPLEERTPPPWSAMDDLKLPTITVQNAHLAAERLINTNTLVAKALLEELIWQLDQYNQSKRKGVI